MTLGETLLVIGTIATSIATVITAITASILALREVKAVRAEVKDLGKTKEASLKTLGEVKAVVDIIPAKIEEVYKVAANGNGHK